MEFNELVKRSKIKKMKFNWWEHEKHQAEMWEHLLLPESTPDPVAEAAANKLGGGIYRMYNAAHEIIYVGKSNDIHRRLLQHVGKRSNTSYFIDEVTKIDFYVDNDPVSQTFLEGIFIMFHLPKYNDEVKNRKEEQQHEHN